MPTLRELLRTAGPDTPATPASTFLRGLTLGALVGAAVAGSVLLGRGRQRSRPAGTAGQDPELPAEPSIPRAGSPER